MEVVAYLFWRNILWVVWMRDEFDANWPIDGLDINWPTVGPRIRSYMCLHLFEINQRMISIVSHAKDFVFTEPGLRAI